MNLKVTASILGLAVFLQACEQAAPPADTANNAPSPDSSVEAAPAASTAGEQLPNAVYWGDTHLHTSYASQAASQSARESGASPWR